MFVGVKYNGLKWVLRDNQLVIRHSPNYKIWISQTFKYLSPLLQSKLTNIDNVDLSYSSSTVGKYIISIGTVP